MGKASIYFFELFFIDTFLLVKRVSATNQKPNHTRTNHGSQFALVNLLLFGVWIHVIDREKVTDVAPGDYIVQSENNEKR